MNKKKPWYKKWWIWIIITFIFILIAVIPFIINELYKKGEGYITVWEGSDVLSFYGTILSFIGTVVLGIVAIYQNKKANTISDRLLKIEEENQMPFIDFLDYEIDFNKMINLLPIMSFSFLDEENNNTYRAIRLLVKNTKEIYINNISIKSIKVFQTSENNYNLEAKNQFDEKRIEFNNSNEYMNQIGSQEYKEILLLFPCDILRYKKNIMNDINISARYVIEFQLTTYSQRKYVEKVEFINHFNYLVRENKVKSEIINKHIYVKEE